MSVYLRLYFMYFKLSLKNILEYRADFFIGILSMFVEQIITISTLFIIFLNIPSIVSWKMEELILMYAFSSLGRSVDLIFFDNYWAFGFRYILPGDFDRVLTKPINSLFQVTAERIQIHGIGFLISGIIALIYSFSKLNIDYSFINIIMIIVFTICSGLIYAGINLFLMTLAFWLNDSLPLMTVTFTFAMVGRFPLEIFPTFIKVIICVFIPYAFTAYFPTTFFLTGDHYSSLSLLTPLVTILVWVVSYFFWKFGNSKYIGAGN